MSTATKRFVIFHNYYDLSPGILYPMAEQIHYGLYWHISVRQASNRVTFCLTCRLPNSRKTKSIDSRILYRIVWADGTSEIGSSSHCFHSENLSNERWTVSRGAPAFMLECRVEINTTVRFEDIFLPNTERVLLNVGGATIRVPKMLLDTHFKKFQPTILDNSEKYRIDSFTEDFMDLLFVVEGYRALNEKNVLNVLSIAKAHGVDTVVEKCEQFLMKKSMKPSAELVGIAKKFNLCSLESSIENPEVGKTGKVSEKPIRPMENKKTIAMSSKDAIRNSEVSTQKVSEKPEKTVRPMENRETQTSAITSNSREFVISHNFYGSLPENSYYGRVESHSNFHWRIHIGYSKKKKLCLGLECWPMSKWSSQLSVTARIEPFVITEAKDDKSNASVFKFDDSNQIFWSNFPKPDSRCEVQFKVEITKAVGFGLVTNAFLSNIETVSLILNYRTLKLPKLVLTSHFKAFQSTLADNQKKVFIDENLEDFKQLLPVLDGLDVIDDKNVSTILDLAHGYGVEIVIRKCEQFLIKDSKKSPEHLTKLANEFKLDLLKHFQQSRTNEKLIESLECPVCYRTYENMPRMLQCGHSFCNSCLSRLHNATCPICCQAFEPGSVTQNYALKNVIEAVFPNLTIRSERVPTIQHRHVSKIVEEEQRCAIM
ncbi:unnamed protein product [Caenorhabditis brenneri]